MPDSTVPTPPKDGRKLLLTYRWFRFQGKSSKLPEARFIPRFSFVHLTNAFLEYTMPASHQLTSEHLLMYETGGTSSWHLFSPKEPFLEPRSYGACSVSSGALLGRRLCARRSARCCLYTSLTCITSRGRPSLCHC